MIITAPGGILEAPIIRQGRTVSTATAPQRCQGIQKPRGWENSAELDQACIHMCECAKVLSLCEINDFCLVQIILMVSCDSKINLS